MLLDECQLAKGLAIFQIAIQIKIQIESQIKN